MLENRMPVLNNADPNAEGVFLYRAKFVTHAVQSDRKFLARAVPGAGSGGSPRKVPHRTAPVLV